MQCFSLPYQQNNIQLFQKIRHKPYATWLDSCKDFNTQGRYDILTAEPDVLITCKNQKAFFYKNHQLIEEKIIDHSFFNWLDLIFQQWKTSFIKQKNILPKNFPLPGLFGYLSYEFNHGVEKIACAKKSELNTCPDAYFGFYPWCIVADHETQTTQLLSFLDNDINLGLYELLKAPHHEDLKPFSLTSAYTSNLTKNDYFEAIHKIKHYLMAGDCYQVNFSQQFIAAYQGDLLTVYQQNRQKMPAPYSAFMEFPEAAILCHSPEHFISAINSQVKTSPIKGTAAKAKNIEEDKMIQQQLIQSEKNRAENIMIVDLLRNDLGKICLPHSIQVEKLCELQSFHHIHHLVSTIIGELPINTSPLQLIKACFPGGSITGAPKHRAMEIIESLEPHLRSIYCGSLIHLDVHNRFNSNIMIRSQLATASHLYAWAGGGIVADSQAEEEYEESLIKINNLF